MYVPEPIKKIIMLMLLSLTGSSFMFSQPKSAGAAYSFSGISASYEHRVTDDAFCEIALKSELGEVFLNRSRLPGISASFCWNLILREWESEEGNILRIFAGPGVHLGWGKDFKRDKGISFGLKGRFGIECDFPRNVSISLSASPVIGLQITKLDQSLKIDYFKNGLLNFILPEIGIRYRF